MATWRLANSLTVLRNQINDFARKRSKLSDGTIGNAAHQAEDSDHNPNSLGVVCALDITNDPAGGLDAHALADRFLAVRHPNLRYIISNHRIAGAWTNWRWTAYTGSSDPHVNHIHISVGVGSDGHAQPGTYDDQTLWNVKGVEDMRSMTRDEVIWNYRLIFGQDPSEQEINGYVNNGWDYIADNEDMKRYAANNGLGYYQYRERMEKALAAVTAQANELAQRPTQENFNALQAQIKACNQTMAELQQEKTDNEQKATGFLHVLANILKKLKP